MAALPSSPAPAAGWAGRSPRRWPRPAPGCCCMAARPSGWRRGSRDLRSAGFAADAIAFDMADRPAMRAAVGSAGPIDILVHNVGERDRRPFAEIEPEDFARLIDVDLVAAHALVKLVVPGMIERGWGRLILVTSIVADLADARRLVLHRRQGRPVGAGPRAGRRARRHRRHVQRPVARLLRHRDQRGSTSPRRPASAIASAARPSAGPSRTRSPAPRCSSPRRPRPTSTATRSPSMAACRRRTGVMHDADTHLSSRA